jgi:hypothetical protein
MAAPLNRDRQGVDRRKNLIVHRVATGAKSLIYWIFTREGLCLVLSYSRPGAKGAYV